MLSRLKLCWLPLWALACLLSGCGQAPQPASDANTAPVKSAKPIVFPRDDLDRVVPLKSPARRVVVIGPGAVETVFALGKGGVLVGRDSGSDYPPQDVKRVPVVADFNGPSFEAVVAQRPDFIIVQGETYDRARVENWQTKCGAPVAQLSATTVDGVAKDIQKIGAWLGTEKQADKVASGFARYDRASSEAPAFFEIGRSPLWTAGRGTLIDDMMIRSALSNVAFQVRGYKPFNLEVLVKVEPDVYVVPVVGQATPTQRNRVLAELRRQPVLKNLECVRRGRVIVVPADWVLRPGPRLTKGMDALRLALVRLPTVKTNN